jgi:hypothetical protein
MHTNRFHRATLYPSPGDDGSILGAEVVGFAIDGGPIIHFTCVVPSTFPATTKILGHCQDDKPIVVCQRDTVQFIYEKSTPNSTSQDGI